MLYHYPSRKPSRLNKVWVLKENIVNFRNILIYRGFEVIVDIKVWINGVKCCSADD